jgi:hypothetical protein
LLISSAYYMMEQMMECRLVKMSTRMDAWLEEMDSRKETVAFQEVTEAYPEKMEANTEEMKPVAVHEEVRKEEATVKPVRALKKWHRGRHLAAGLRGKLKERTKGSSGSLKKLAATCKGSPTVQEWYSARGTGIRAKHIRHCKRNPYWMDG